MQAFDLALKPLWHKVGLGAASHMLLFAASGAKRGRVRIGCLMQGVVFPSPGWNRDLYRCSMAKVARLFVG